MLNVIKRLLFVACKEIDIVLVAEIEKRFPMLLQRKTKKKPLKATNTFTLPCSRRANFWRSMYVLDLHDDAQHPVKCAAVKNSAIQWDEAFSSELFILFDSFAWI